MNQGFHTKVVGFRGCFVSASCHLDRPDGLHIRSGYGARSISHKSAQLGIYFEGVIAAIRPDLTCIRPNIYRFVWGSATFP